MSDRLPPPPHPIVWTLLYLPFGALGGFVTVPLAFLANEHGISISDAGILVASGLVSQWLKWLWAPMVDVTLSPKRWYLISVVGSALGVFLLSSIPLSPQTLSLLIAVYMVASLVNTVVGMAIETMLAAVTPPEEVGRTSAWFQAGNLGGSAFGGGLGLLLLQNLPQPWMTGAVLAVSFLLCSLGLLVLPDVKAHVHAGGALGALRDVVRDVGMLARTKGGLLSAFLCFLPVGTGAAQGTLTQSNIAAAWGAGANEVMWVQGFSSGVVTVAGCFAGGWLCDRLAPRTAYVVIGLGLAAVAVGMVLTPHTVTAYVVWNLVYAGGVGLAYAAFTAIVLSAIGTTAGATKYTVFASLSNFPIFYLGLVLSRVADVGEGSDARVGADAMLLTEAALGVAGVAVFYVFSQLVGRSRLPAHVEELQERAAAA